MLYPLLLLKIKLKTKPEDNSNVFNKYFINMSSMIQSTIKFSKNKFHDFISNININSFFIKPVDKTDSKLFCLSII